MTTKDKQELADRYRTWPQDRLLLAATVEAHEYEPEAVEVMREVLDETGVSTEAMAEQEAAVVAAVAQLECTAIERVRGLDSITREQLDRELARGARFIAYQFCYSYLAATVKRRSMIHFIRGGESRRGPAMRYILSSMLLGWWGFPWGPFYTIEAILVSLGGGEDLTDDVLRLINHDKKYNEGEGLPWLNHNTPKQRNAQQIDGEGLGMAGAKA